MNREELIQKAEAMRWHPERRTEEIAWGGVSYVTPGGKEAFQDGPAAPDTAQGEAPEVPDLPEPDPAAEAELEQQFQDGEAVHAFVALAKDPSTPLAKLEAAYARAVPARERLRSAGLQGWE